jgi:hypothetical protein
MLELFITGRLLLNRIVLHVQIGSDGTVLIERRATISDEHAHMRRTETLRQVNMTAGTAAAGTMPWFGDVKPKAPRAADRTQTIPRLQSHLSTQVSLVSSMARVMDGTPWQRLVHTDSALVLHTLGTSMLACCRRATVTTISLTHHSGSSACFAPSTASGQCAGQFVSSSRGAHHDATSNGKCAECAPRRSSSDYATC